MISKHQREAISHFTFPRGVCAPDPKVRLRLTPELDDEFPYRIRYLFTGSEPGTKTISDSAGSSGPAAVSNKIGIPLARDHSMLSVT